MEVKLPSGSGEVLVTEHGGRIAELRPLPDGPNLFWRGSTLLPLTGGDRLWMGPEREIFYPPGDDVVRESWACPEELDPGAWRLATDDDGRVELQQSALGADLRRTVEPLEAPLADGDLPWSGYRVRNEVSTDRAWSAWNLIMVPAPADLYVREARGAVHVYPPVPDMRDGWIPAEGRAPEWKLGLAPPDDGLVVLAAVGRDDPGPLVVKLVELDPDGTYVDVPPLGDGPATAIQLYSSPDLGFCEIEHHAPLETRASSTTVFGAWGGREARLALLDAILADLPSS